MSAPLQLMFVGCGAFARRYHLPAIVADPNVRLAAICDPTPAPETLEFAAQYGAPMVETVDQLPAHEGQTVAIVSSPHMLHAEHAAALLLRGIHVLLDKPFVMRQSDADSLSRTAQSKGLVNGVAFNRRFDRSCLRTREILADGGIGALRFVQTVQLGYERAGWFLVPELGGGGPYTGRAAHMADLIPWLLGQRPNRIRSRLRGGSAARSDEGGFIELQFGALEWQMTCIEEGWHMWDEVRLFGDDGLIEMRRPLSLPIGWTLEWSSKRGDHIERLAADPHPGDATRNFFAAVRGEEPIACSFADATASVQIIEAAFHSARSGGNWMELANTGFR